MFPLAAQVASWSPRVFAAVRGMIPAIAKESPKTLGTIATRLQALGAKVEPTVESLVNYVKNNKMNAAMLLGTVASLGMNVVDVVPDLDEESKKKLTKVSEGTDALTSYAIAIGAASRSEALASLDLTSEQRANQNFVGDVLNWAVGEYGRDGVITAHLMAQSFFELSHDQVVKGLADKLHVSAAERARAAGR